MGLTSKFWQNVYSSLIEISLPQQEKTFTIPFYNPSSLTSTKSNHANVPKPSNSHYIQSPLSKNLTIKYSHNNSIFNNIVWPADHQPSRFSFPVNCPLCINTVNNPHLFHITLQHTRERKKLHKSIWIEK